MRTLKYPTTNPNKRIAFKSVFRTKKRSKIIHTRAEQASTTEIRLVDKDREMANILIGLMNFLGITKHFLATFWYCDYYTLLFKLHKLVRLMVTYGLSSCLFPILFLKKKIIPNSHLYTQVFVFPSNDEEFKVQYVTVLEKLKQVNQGRETSFIRDFSLALVNVCQHLLVNASANDWIKITFPISLSDCKNLHNVLTNHATMFENNLLSMFVFFV